MRHPVQDDASREADDVAFFAGKPDGSTPYSGLTQATDGKLYGTTELGGSSDYGAVFSLYAGLGPFIEAQRDFGIVGSNIVILGNNLTGTTAVGFNGTAAAFTVVSDTEITATVPAGATTGQSYVYRPSGTLVSNVAFRVP